LKREFVNSSNLLSVGYEQDSEVLEIQFKSGGIYQYSKVPPNIYASLMAASSHGKYFSAYIREVFHTVKVG
jgi:hypothetical protein